MKTKQEIKKWLLENCVDEYGNLDLNFLDFSDFDGDIFLSCWRIKANFHCNFHAVDGYLEQNCQTCLGSIYQDHHYVGENVYQSGHMVKRNCYQSDQEVDGNIYQSCHYCLGKVYRFED